jgi:hypothetical protein
MGQRLRAESSVLASACECKDSTRDADIKPNDLRPGGESRTRVIRIS